MRRIFSLYSSGRYTLTSLRKTINEETGQKISKSYLHRILTSRFYLGHFTWRGHEYSGTHPVLVDSETYERAQRIVSGRNKSKPRKHDFAFSHRLTCAHCNCAITAELHKGKYIYYRCTFGRGRHAFQYLTEQRLSDLMGTFLLGLHVSDEIASAIADSVDRHAAEGNAAVREEISRLNQRRTALQTRMRKAYEDRLDRLNDDLKDDLIDDKFWREQMTKWREDQKNMDASLSRYLEPSAPIPQLSATRVVELATRAHSLYMSRNNSDRAKLLKMMISSCATDGVNVFPTFKEPFTRLLASGYPRQVQ